MSEQNCNLFAKVYVAIFAGIYLVYKLGFGIFE